MTGPVFVDTNVLAYYTDNWIPSISQPRSKQSSGFVAANGASN